MTPKIGDLFLGSKGYPVTKNYATHIKYNPGTMYGVDYGCPDGTPLLACWDGTIATGTNPKGTDWGNYCWLTSTENTYYKAGYAHCKSFVVKSGKVVRGQLIGYSDSSGYCFGAHLHFSVAYKGKPVNPEKMAWLIKNPTKPVVPGKGVEMINAADADMLGRVVFYLPRATSSIKGYIGKTFASTLRAWEKSSGSWKARKNVYLVKYPAAIKEVAALKKKITAIEKAHATAVKKTAEEYQKAIDKANKNVEAVQTEYTALELKMGEQTKAMEILQEKLKTYQKPQGPEIPRVTKFDTFWVRVWKRLLQLIAK